jgi:acetyl-CoA synthetase
VSIQAYKAAQSFLLDRLNDPLVADEQFRWPELGRFNWALDWFDSELAAGPLRHNAALHILGEHAEEVSFAEMAERSNRITSGLRQRGVCRGTASC